MTNASRLMLPSTKFVEGTESTSIMLRERMQQEILKISSKSMYEYWSKKSVQMKGLIIQNESHVSLLSEQ